MGQMFFFHKYYKANNVVVVVFLYAFIFVLKYGEYDVFIRKLDGKKYMSMKQTIFTVINILKRNQYLFIFHSSRRNVCV